MEDILQKLVAFPTVTGDHTATHEALDYIASFVRERGMHVERFDSNGFESLVASIKPGRKTPKVLLAAHIDVVPAAEEMFAVRKENNKLYGRGVLDMKFAVAAYLQIVDDLREDLQAYDFGLMITSDEEIGGQNGVAPLVTEGYVPEVCILPDGGDNWQLQTYAKGFLYLKIAAHGKPAHGSRPWLGDNAILKLMQITNEIRTLFTHASAETNTLNVGKFSGGQTINQVADYAEALLDIRVTSEAEKAAILQNISTICGKHDAEVSLEVQGATCEFDLNDPLLRPFANLITEVTGSKVSGSRTLGTSDARFFAARNVPCISLYPTGGGHHGPGEWLDEQAFYHFREILWRYLQQIAKR